MFFLSRFLPRVYRDWENLEINILIFHKLKKYRDLCTCDLALSNCLACDNLTSKRPIIKKKACDYYTPKCMWALVRAIARYS